MRTPSPAPLLTIPDKLSERLFDGKAIVVVEPVADYRHALFPEELALVQDACDKRVLEFSTGRHCAHLALQRLGHKPHPILKGPKREPLWPADIVGSISHCHDLAGAAVAHSSNLRSVGFDLERIKQLNPEIARHVCTTEENVWLGHQSPPQRNLALLLIFSLKESVFKCVYQATGHSLGFKQCRVLPAFDTGVADIVIRGLDIDLSEEPVYAHFCIGESHIYAGTFWDHLPAVG